MVDCWMDGRGRPVEGAERFSWQKAERERNLDRQPPPLTLGQCTIALAAPVLSLCCGLMLESYTHIAQYASDCIEY